jgi:hypothetical protein
MSHHVALQRPQEPRVVMGEVTLRRAEQLLRRIARE